MDKYHIMKCLIIKKQYHDLILDNGKTWEMRTTKTKIRGRIGLIEVGSGLIVGETTILDSISPSVSLSSLRAYYFHRVENADLLKKWRIAWVLSDSMRYNKPVPYDHPKGAVIWVNL